MTINNYWGIDDLHPKFAPIPEAPRCPICGSVRGTVIYTRDSEPIGCDMCLDTKIRCPHCGSEAWDELIWKDGAPIGCDRCVREVERWEWGG